MIIQARDGASNLVNACGEDHFRMDLPTHSPGLRVFGGILGFSVDLRRESVTSVGIASNGGLSAASSWWRIQRPLDFGITFPRTSGLNSRLDRSAAPVPQFETSVTRGEAWKKRYRKQWQEAKKKWNGVSVYFSAYRSKRNLQEK